ncbi:MAG TPA: hypothetical protein VEB22_15445 [Phycisphaerales bacterium]|nr:hypothetical protein [Phycisphaerales bacterium]
MAVETLFEISEAIEEIGEDFTRAHAAIASLLETGAQTKRDVQGLRAAVTGLRGEIRGTRKHLDEIEAASYLDVVNGERTIAAWLWERQVRIGLVKAEAGLRELDRKAGEVVAGVDRRTVLVRQGDTWHSLAVRELGDHTAWRRLLEANPTVSPAGLVPGLVLVVPR